MRLQVTRIERAWLRRLVMVAVLPLMVSLGVLLGAAAGVLDMMFSLARSWGPAWRGKVDDPEHPYGYCEIGVVGRALHIRTPVELLAQLSKYAPFVHNVPGVNSPGGPREPHNIPPWEDGGFRVTDPDKWAKALGRILVADDEMPGSIIGEAFADAAERVVDNGQPERDGWTWPRFGYAGQLDPRED